ncbi:MAG: TrkA family potassium uptake protein [Planctomycetaceae bacterium]|nr:TrkA family potassium uptake protein [Planctomycetaceae bacterium]
MGNDLFIIIIGCGRLGSHLANNLSRAGHAVVVVDSDEEAFGNLSAEFSGFRVQGDATELAVLKQAKADKADVVIATTRDDNVNLMVVQVARKVFSVARVLARVFDPSRKPIYRQLGIESICPTSMAGDLFLETIAIPGSLGEQE